MRNPVHACALTKLPAFCTNNMDETKLPCQALWGARGKLPAYVGGDNETSTIAESEYTFVNNTQRYALSHIDGEQGLYEDDEVVEIVGCGINHANADKITFFGFASMRNRFQENIPRFLLGNRRWSEEEDSEITVAKKNVIVFFVGLATIEECLLKDDGKRLVDFAEPFRPLMRALGFIQHEGKQMHTFMKGIQREFTKSRSEEIQDCLSKGLENPPVPEHPLDRMLLDVVDRNLTFLYTKQPLTRLAAEFPRE